MRRIAVASQNRVTVTSHAGRCRRFWIYEIEDGSVLDKSLLELSRDDTFHESHSRAVHPLDDVDVLITGGMGRGLVQRLAAKNVRGLVTTEEDPDRAVAAFLEDSLELRPPGDHAHGERGNAQPRARHGTETTPKPPGASGGASGHHRG